MNELDNLIIYKSMINLINYSNGMLKKYPKIERNMIVRDIYNINYEIMKLIIKCYKETNKSKKYYFLNEIDINIKLYSVYIRLSYKNKYISSSNYGSWSRKLSNINNLEHQILQEILCNLNLLFHKFSL